MNLVMRRQSPQPQLLIMTEDKISSCHTTLATHYNKMNEIIPHMTKTQMAQYLGKVHILNIVQPEGIVSKMYTSEPTTSETKFVV